MFRVFVRTRMYAFPRTWEALTLFCGHPLSVPDLRSLFVAVYAAGFTCLRMSTRDDPAGLSFVQRGIERWAPRWRTPVTLLAVIGFCVVWAAFAYFLPWSGLSVHPDSVITPPS